MRAIPIGNLKVELIDVAKVKRVYTTGGWHIPIMIRLVDHSGKETAIDNLFLNKEDAALVIAAIQAEMDAYYKRSEIQAEMDASYKRSGIGCVVS